MPRKFALTWQSGAAGYSGRWRKKYHGKTYYFAGGTGKFDRQAYDEAVNAWHAQKAKLDAAAPRPLQREYEAVVTEWEQVLAWSSQHNDQEMAATAAEKLDRLRQRLAAPVLSRLAKDDHFQAQFLRPTIELPADLAKTSADELAAGVVRLNASHQITSQKLRQLAQELDGSPERIEREIWNDRLENQQRRAATPECSVRGNVETYLAEMSNRANAGELSLGRLYAVRLHLSHFQEHVGADMSVKEIDGAVLLRYHTQLLNEVGKKKWTRTTARHYSVTVKSFIRWLWHADAIPTLPRILDGKSQRMTITAPLSEVVVFTTAEVKSLLGISTDRLKLYILLMLNCGMTQKDIADLKISEVDWKQGRIIRKRSKTADCERVPSVNYLLWPETIRLLRQEKAPGSKELVLLNANGSPIWSEEMVGAEGGGQVKYRKNDNVKNSFDRVRKKLGIDKSLRSLKKTSATLLRGNDKFQGLEGLFLGHAPQSMSDRHYTQAPQALLDQALEWLAAQYDLK